MTDHRDPGCRICGKRYATATETAHHEEEDHAVSPRDLTREEALPWTWVRRRPVLVRAALIEQPFTVRTNEGDTLRLDGGWLLEGDDGRRWPVDREHFARHYEIVGKKTRCDFCDADACDHCQDCGGDGECQEGCECESCYDPSNLTADDVDDGAYGGSPDDD